MSNAHKSGSESFKYSYDTEICRKKVEEYKVEHIFDTFLYVETVDPTYSLLAIVDINGGTIYMIEESYSDVKDTDGSVYVHLSHTDISQLPELKEIAISLLQSTVGDTLPTPEKCTFRFDHLVFSPPSR